MNKDENTEIEFISSMLMQLAEMAKKNEKHFLAYLISVAIEEVHSPLARNIRMPATDSERKVASIS